MTTGNSSNSLLASFFQVGYVTRDIDLAIAGLREHVRFGEFLIVPAEARYREVLGAGDPQVRFVYLRGDADLIRQRSSRRVGHFFDPALLPTQFEALEEPPDALTVDIALTPDALVSHIVTALRGGGVG